MRNKRNVGNRKKVVREQPRKDSKQKRVNLDNVREDKVKDISETCASNDVSWYAHNAELLRSAASLPFSNTVGQPLAFYKDWKTWVDSSKGDWVNTVPGVMALEWVPQIGGEFIDAINQAKNSIYSFTVHANSRNTTYNATDEMLVILCGANLFSMIALGIRAYGLMRNFDQRNEYTPRALVEASGFDYEDLRANLSKMWFDLNELVARSSQIWIPNNLPFIERWFWLSTNVYMDGDSLKSQFYLFRPQQYLVYNETYNSEGGAAQYEPVTTTSSLTWDAYMNVVNEQFDALLNSEDRGIIFGDILKAYGADSIYALKEVPVDYRVIPVYDKEVLTQIENCSVIDNSPLAIAQSQTTLNLYTQGTQATSATGTINSAKLCPSRQVLNFHQMEAPTPEQIMVATRLKAMGSTPVYDSSGKLCDIIPTTCGTETIARVYIYVYTSGPASAPVQTLTPVSYPVNIWSTQNKNTLAMFLWCTFDWCPWIYSILGKPEAIPTYNVTTSETWVEPVTQFALGDYDNFTTIDFETVRKMHNTAVYSEFGVPTL